MAVENLFLIESPLQFKSYLNIRENSEYFDDENTIILIRLNENVSNLEQIINLYKKYNVKSKLLKFHSPRGNKLALIYKTCSTVVRNLDSIIKAKKVYIGDYRSQWMIFVSKVNLNKDIYYIDDGMATINFYRSVVERKPKGDKIFKILTTFNLPSNPWCKVIQVNPRKQIKPIDTSVAYILGMPMIEFGVISEAEYFLFVKKSIDKASKEKKAKIYYLPHRNENEPHTRRITENHAVSLLKIDVPIEEHLAFLNVIPGMYFSLYSTSIVNIEMLFEDVQVYSYRVPSSLISDRYTKQIDPVYKYIENCTSIKMIK